MWRRGFASYASNRVALVPRDRTHLQRWSIDEAAGVQKPKADVDLLERLWRPGPTILRIS